MQTHKIQVAIEKLQKAQITTHSRGEERQESNLMAQLVQALSAMSRISVAKGDKGDPGYTPKRNIDYFDGKNGRDGENGKDGYTPIKGKDYFDGAPGKDGTDATVDRLELMEIADAEVQTHKQEFDHKNIHDSKIIGEFEVDTASLQEGEFLQVRGKKLVGVAMPVQQFQRQFGIGGNATSGRYRIKTVTASYALDPLDQILHVDASAGNVVISFYEAAGNEGSHVFIKRIDSVLANTVTFTMHGSETIDFESLYQLVNQGSGAEVYTDADNFFIKHT